MDTTIRNLDESAYRALKARAALTGKTIGQTVNEAIRAYLSSTNPFPKTGSLRDLRPRSYPDGDEDLSERLDATIYGA